jgi:hypothetical protein
MGSNIRQRISAQLAPENILVLCHQLSQTLCTISRHTRFLCALHKTFHSCRQFLRASLIYLRIMIVDRIIFENVTVEQLLFLEAREHVVGLYHVLVPVNFFTLFPSRVFLVMRARLHLLPSCRVFALRHWCHIRKVFNQRGNICGFGKKLLTGRPMAAFPS